MTIWVFLYQVFHVFSFTLARVFWIFWVFLVFILLSSEYLEIIWDHILEWFGIRVNKMGYFGLSLLYLSLSCLITVDLSLGFLLCIVVYRFSFLFRLYLGMCSFCKCSSSIVWDNSLNFIAINSFSMLFFNVSVKVILLGYFNAAFHADFMYFPHLILG